LSAWQPPPETGKAIPCFLLGLVHNLMNGWRKKEEEGNVSLQGRNIRAHHRER